MENFPLVISVSSKGSLFASDEGDDYLQKCARRSDHKEVSHRVVHCQKENHEKHPHLSRR